MLTVTTCMLTVSAGHIWKVSSWFLTGKYKTLRYIFCKHYYKSHLWSMWVQPIIFLFITFTTWNCKNKYVIIVVDFLIGHYTYRMFPTDIDIVPTSCIFTLSEIFTRLPIQSSDNDSTVETPYSTIPYTTIFYITRWTHGPQNLQRPIRTLIVLLGFGIKQIFM